MELDDYKVILYRSLRAVAVDANGASLIESAARFSIDPAALADNRQSFTPSREVVDAIETLKGFGKFIVSRRAE